MRVTVLCLDPSITAADLAARAADVCDALPDHTVVTIVGPVEVAEYAHRPVDIDVGTLSRVSGPLAPLVRAFRGNIRGRRAWRALRADADAMETLRTAELVVVVDPLANRAAWVLAKKHGVHAVTGLRAVRYAVNQAAGK